MTRGSNRLDLWLSRAAAQARVVSAFYGLAAGALLLSLGLMLSVLIERFFPSSRVAHPFFIFAASVSAVVPIALTIIRFRAVSNRLVVAAGVKDPGLREKLVSAVELDEEMTILGEMYTCSPGLTVVACEQAADEAGRASPLEALGLSHKPLISAVMISAALVLLAAALVPAGMRTLAKKVVSGPATGVSAAPFPGASFEIGIRPPRYTGLAERVQSARIGSFKALKGSDVKVAISYTGGISSAEAVRGGSRIPMEGKGLSSASVQFVVDRPFTYRIDIKNMTGEISTPEYGAEIIEDHPPAVELVAPASLLQGEKIVGNDESLKLAAEASDDFGMGPVSLLAEVRGREKRITLAEAKEGRRSWAGDYTLELSTLGLSPGDRVALTIEAADNDTVSGPKKGRSRTYYLKVFSSTEHLSEFLDGLEKAWELMISWLAADLGQDGMDRNALSGDALSELERLSAASARDKIVPRPVATAVQRAASELRRIRIPGGDSQERHDWRISAEVKVLETHVLALQDLLDFERIKQVSALAADISARKRRLEGLLQKYREGKSEALRREIDAEMAAMEERLKEMSRLLAKTAHGTGDVNLNRKALKDLDLSKLAETMKQARGSFASDDPAALAAKLEEIARKMDALSAGMAGMGAALGGSRYSELEAEAAALMAELDAVTAEQKDLLDQTLKYREMLKEREEKKVASRASEVKARLHRLIKAFREDVVKVPAGLEPSIESKVRALPDSLDALDKMVSEGEFWDAREAAGGIQLRTAEVMRGAVNPAARFQEDYGFFSGLLGGVSRQAPPETIKRTSGWHEKARAITDVFEKLFPKPGDLMNPQETKQFSGLSPKQGEVGNKTRKVRDGYSKLQREMPMMPAEPGEKLDQAAGEMGMASGNLKTMNPYGARSHQEGALDALKGARDALGKMSSPSPDAPFPFAQQGGSGEEQGRYDPGMSRERVEIPKPSDYVVPKEYRQDIMDAMKEHAPRGYEELTKKYYEEITK